MQTRKLIANSFFFFCVCKDICPDEKVIELSMQSGKL